MTVSKAAQRASRKYHDKVYDNILVRFPKDTKNRIQSTGETVNGYITHAVEEKLRQDGK
jgi:hypothetical protein